MTQARPYNASSGRANPTVELLGLEVLALLLARRLDKPVEDLFCLEEKQ